MEDRTGAGIVTVEMEEMDEDEFLIGDVDEVQ
jgi:hypothetical protein